MSDNNYYFAEEDEEVVELKYNGMTNLSEKGTSLLVRSEKQPIGKVTAFIPSYGPELYKEPARVELSEKLKYTNENVIDYWENNSDELEPVHFFEWLDMMEDIEAENGECIYVYRISTLRNCFINNCSKEATYIHKNREPIDGLKMQDRIVSCEEHNPENLIDPSKWKKIP